MYNFFILFLYCLNRNPDCINNKYHLLCCCLAATAAAAPAGGKKAAAAATAEAEREALTGLAQSQAEEVDSSSLFVKNLAWGTDEEALRQHFEAAAAAKGTQVLVLTVAAAVVSTVAAAVASIRDFLPPRLAVLLPAHGHLC